MNFRLVWNSIGKALLVLAACLLPSMFVALYYQESTWKYFLIVAIIAAIPGGALQFLKPKTHNFYAHDGLAITSLSWIFVSLIGALPFWLSGEIPSYIDAFFESVSGFTTTGSTIIVVVEDLSQSMLFWRSFTHWIGGLGVLALLMALMPAARGSTLQIMKAESTGPIQGKVVPKVGDTAKILWSIYIAMSALMILLLSAGGMPFFDTLIHTFGTAGTGGFSNHSLSVGFFDNTYFTVVITIFMFLFGVNLALYWNIVQGKPKQFFKDEEFRFYLISVVLAIVLIVANLSMHNFYDTIGETIEHAAFQVSSIVSTTGFATANFDLWPTFSKAILLLLMFAGSSAGSTAGGIKFIRIVLIFKIIRREITRIAHPRSIQTVKFNGRVVDEKTISGVLTYLGVYTLIIFVGVLGVSLEGKDLITTITSVITTFNNVGPGLQIVGPIGNFADFQPFTKFIFTLLMLAGRLEIYPLMMLFVPSFWKRHSR